MYDPLLNAGEGKFVFPSVSFRSCLDVVVVTAPKSPYKVIFDRMTKPIVGFDPHF